MKIKASVNDYSIISQLIKSQDSLKAFESGSLEFLKNFKDAVEKKMDEFMKSGKQQDAKEDFIDTHIPEDVLKSLIEDIKSSPFIMLLNKIEELSSKEEATLKPIK